MAREAGVSKSTVQRIWSHNEIKPHRLETFKISNDPNFEEKFWDVIGSIWIRPSELWCSVATRRVSAKHWSARNALFLCVRVYGRTQTHDYIRHGTITLFAALSYLEGKIISRTEESHTHVEWLRFLKQIDRETPKDLDLHLIMDNYATHKHPAVQHWLKAHGHFHIHFNSDQLLMVKPRRALLRGIDFRSGPRRKQPEGGQHFMFIENPEKFNRLVMEYLG
jgi:DDE superfamily endonuclease